MTILTLELEGSLFQKKQAIILHGAEARSMRIQTDVSRSLIDPETLDGPLCSVIFYAMRNCKKLKIKGAISEKLRRNITIFQEAWHCHFPHLYNLVEIEPSGVIPSRKLIKDPDENNSVLTFSGGVDSMFSLLRRQNEKQLIPSEQINSALLVHGFDIPSSNQVDFDNLRKRIEKITDSVGIELNVLKTSFRASLPTNWDHSHGAALAGALHLYSGLSSMGMIASSDPYNYVSFVPHAWGSSPATDYLLSGSQMEIIHDGAGYSRPQKLAYLAEHWPSILKLAQFCWSSKVRSTNCGTCDKCVQTRLSLLAAGYNEDLCFDTKFETKMLNNIRFSEETLGDILPLLDLATENSCNDPWTHSVREQINPFLPVLYKSNRSVGRSLRYFRAAIRELIPT